MSNQPKINLLDLSQSKMREFFASIGEKPFRVDQVMKWIYHYGVTDFNEMTNLNKVLRSKLTESCEIQAPEISVKKASSDGTIKYALKLAGGQEVETVWIPEKDRRTLCVSSQVGCALECSFCSTATQGFNRNLSTAEIIGQVWRVAQDIGFYADTKVRPVTNVVMMGMGEPLLNVNNVVPAMELMMDDFGFGISKRRVTLSTSDVVPALDILKSRIDVALAISLHAPNDTLRNELVPINQKYPIAEFLAASKRYIDGSKANDSITIEYVMIQEVNDSMDQAHELGKLLRSIPVKVNLIPFNPYPGSPYKRSSNSRIDRFSKVLQDKYGITTIVRRTRGDDVDAACGQLVGDVNDRTKRTMPSRTSVGDIKVTQVR